MWCWGEKDLYQAGKDVQKIRVINDVAIEMSSEKTVLKRWKEYLEELMNEENQKRMDGGQFHGP